MTSGITSVGSGVMYGWGITVAVFVAVILLLILVSKNFRQFLLGVVTTGILFGVYKFSRWVGVSAQEGNKTPITWVTYITLFIVISLIVGGLLMRNKKIKEFMDFEVMEVENVKTKHKKV